MKLSPSEVLALRKLVDGDEPLSPRESMLTAMRRFERASLADAVGREYRRANAWKYSCWLTWALVGVGIVVAWRIIL